MAIEYLGENACRGRFAHASSTREKVRVVQAVMLDRVMQRSSNDILARYLFKGLRPPFSGNDLIRHLNKDKAFPAKYKALVGSKM